MAAFLLIGLCEHPKNGYHGHPQKRQTHYLTSFDSGAAARLAAVSHLRNVGRTKPNHGSREGTQPGPFSNCEAMGMVSDGLGVPTPPGMQLFPHGLKPETIRASASPACPLTPTAEYRMYVSHAHHLPQTLMEVQNFGIKSSKAFLYKRGLARPLMGASSANTLRMTRAKEDITLR